MAKVNTTGKDQIYIFFLFNDMLCYASMEKKCNEKDKNSITSKRLFL